MDGRRWLDSNVPWTYGRTLCHRASALMIHSLAVSVIPRCPSSDCLGVLKGIRREVAASALSLSVLDAGRLSDARSAYFAREKESMKLIGASAAALLAVTGMGFFGLGSFWVAQRHRQIGIRRALGARQWDVRIHFHAENLAVSSLGAVAGVCAALLLNLSAMHCLNNSVCHCRSLQFPYWQLSSSAS